MEIPRFDFMWQYLDHWAQEMPGEKAFWHDGQYITYGEAVHLTGNIAANLQERGVGKGDRVVTILPSRPEFLLVYLAASQIGAVTVPFDVRYKIDDLRRFLEKVKPAAVISMADFKENDIATQLQSLEELLPAGNTFFIGESGFARPFEELTSSSKQPGPTVEICADEDNLIVFTGGTTGHPKGAVLSHRNVTWMAAVEEAFLRKELLRAGVSGRLSSLAALPPSHVGGSVEFMGTGVIGGYLIYFLDSWSPYKVLDITVGQKIPWIGGVPTMYSILLSLPDLDRYDLSCVQLVLMSGERVTLKLLRDVKEKICDRIVNGYGSTEAGPEVTFTVPEDPPEDLADGYVGKPLATVDIRITDDAGKELPPGEEGEVLVKSDFTIDHYFEMPEEDQLGFTEDGYCITGDLGFLDRKGGLWLRGRKKHIIRVGSYTVMPTEVEEVALKMPEIGMAAALGAPDPIYHEVVWLFTVPTMGKRLSEAAVIDFMKERLADFKVPRRVVIRDSIPTTRIGKADRMALMKELESQNWKVE
jgi:fatty-acyl-CoA synthase